MARIAQIRRTVQAAREHYGNVLHVYCRLIDLGISRARARRTAIVLCWRIG